jgi:hypothetical protein
MKLNVFQNVQRKYEYAQVLLNQIKIMKIISHQITVYAKLYKDFENGELRESYVKSMNISFIYRRRNCAQIPEY